MEFLTKLSTRKDLPRGFIRMYDVELACVVGHIAAAVFGTLDSFHHASRSYPENYLDGKWWAPMPLNRLQNVFIEFTQKQLRSAIKTLVDKGLIEKTKPFSKKGNQTTYFRITCEGYKWTHISNPDEPVPPEWEVPRAPGWGVQPGGFGGQFGAAGAGLANAAQEVPNRGPQPLENPGIPHLPSGADRFALEGKSYKEIKTNNSSKLGVCVRPTNAGADAAASQGCHTHPHGQKLENSNATQPAGSKSTPKQPVSGAVSREQIQAKVNALGWGENVSKAAWSFVLNMQDLGKAVRWPQMELILEKLKTYPEEIAIDCFEEAVLQNLPTIYPERIDNAVRRHKLTFKQSIIKHEKRVEFPPNPGIPQDLIAKGIKTWAQVHLAKCVFGKPGFEHIGCKDHANFAK